MADDDVREIIQLASEEINRQWSRIVACFASADPEFIESLPEETSYAPTPDSRMMFRYLLEDGHMVVLSAVTDDRVIRATFSEEEVQVETFTSSGEFVSTTRQPGASADPSMN